MVQPSLAVMVIGRADPLTVPPEDQNGAGFGGPHPGQPGLDLSSVLALINNFEPITLNPTIPFDVHPDPISTGGEIFFYPEKIRSIIRDFLFKRGVWGKILLVLILQKDLEDSLAILAIQSPNTAPSPCNGMSIAGNPGVISIWDVNSIRLSILMGVRLKR